MVTHPEISITATDEMVSATNARLAVTLRAELLDILDQISTAARDAANELDAAGPGQPPPASISRLRVYADVADVGADQLRAAVTVVEPRRLCEPGAHDVRCGATGCDRSLTRHLPNHRPENITCRRCGAALAEVWVQEQEPASG